MFNSDQQVTWKCRVRQVLLQRLRRPYPPFTSLPTKPTLSILLNSSRNADRSRSRDKAVTGDEEDEISTMSTVRDIEVSKLGVDNYSRWKIEIEDALDAAELADVVRGIKAIPTNLSEPTKIASWKEKDSRARTIIRKTLSERDYVGKFSLKSE